MLKEPIDGIKKHKILVFLEMNSFIPHYICALYMDLLFLYNIKDLFFKERFRFALLGLLVVVGCKNEPAEPTLPQKKVWFKAFHESGDLVEFRHDLTIYTDSTFVYDSKEKDHGHSKYEKFEGVAFIQNDTLHFSRKDMNGAGNKAVLKNGMLEFSEDGKMFRLEIAENHTPLKSILDLREYRDFAIFSYYPTKKRDRNQSYDLSPEEFKYTIEILDCVFQEQKSFLLPQAEYIKQLIPYRNRKGEIEVRVNLFCKNKLDPNGFKYYPLTLTNVGNCKASFVVVFKANYYTDFMISEEL